MTALNGPLAKYHLESVALGRPLMCRTMLWRSGRVIVFDRVIAVCHIRRQAIGGLRRQSGAPTGGR